MFARLRLYDSHTLNNKDQSRFGYIEPFIPTPLEPLR